MKLTSYFNHFLAEKVNLNATRMDALKTRTEAITNYLERDEVFGPLLLAAIPQGSYAQKTIIRPRSDGTFDADLLLHLDPVPDWASCEYVGKLYTALGRSPVYKEMRHRRTRCVYIDYADEFHVDLVPYVEIDGRGYITNRKTDDRELTDPKGFTGWLKGQNDLAGGNLIKVIRLLKYVRDITWGLQVKSVIFTTLIGERVNALSLTLEPGCYADVPWTLRKVVADLDAYLQSNPTIPAIVDPGGTDDRFDERWDQDGYVKFRDELHALASKVETAYHASDVATSLAAWQEVFGPDFKQPPASSGSASARDGLIVVEGRTQPATERFLDKDFGFPLQFNGHRVRVVGRVKPKDGFPTYHLRTRENQVVKRRGLVFEIVECTVPLPYDIYWKVRNHGAEAEHAGALRGEIKRGGRTLVESTAYTGSHWVECYIVKDGACVARARQPVIIT